MNSEEKLRTEVPLNRNRRPSLDDLGFRSFDGPSCGLTSCCRTRSHFHCKYCDFGTSQIVNGVAHKRLCTMNPANQLKEYSRIPSGTDSGLLQHETIIRSSQPFPYYSTLSQTPASVSLPSQTSNNQTNSKIMTTQPSTMFNFVLPNQNTQYSSLYGNQNVFPNPNMFSPSSFNGFNQLDPWLSQPRLIPPGVHSGGSVPPEIIGNSRNPYEKLETTNSPTSHGCCGRIESTAIGMCSPLTAEAYKVVSKELNFTSKIDSQNWYCNPQNMVGFGMQNTQQPSCKYNEPFPPCSISQISLLLLEQTDMRQAEECINVEELCFESPPQKINEVKPPGVVPKLEGKSQSSESSKPVEGTTEDLQNAFSSCMQVSTSNCSNLTAKKGTEIEEPQKNKTEEFSCINKPEYQTIFSQSFTESTEGINENDLSSSSDGSDIIVEESDGEVEAFDIESEKLFLSPKCLVCDKTITSTYTFGFIKLQDDSPLTTTTHVSILKKLSEVVNHNFSKMKNCFICKRCLNLINMVDCLEIKLTSAKTELKNIFKTGQDGNSVTKLHDNKDWNKLTIKNIKENSQYLSNSENNVYKVCKPPVENNESKVIVEKPKKIIDQSEVFCNICDKNYSSAYYFSKHKQQHTKSYSFYCDRCGKGFSILKKLDDHLFSHSKSSRYQCELCGKRFVQKHVLNDHLKKHKGEFKYKCKYCDKGFMRENVYTIHLRLHTKENPFICQNCGRMFNANSNLKAHIQVCSNNLLHSCSKCDKKFPLKSLLQKHISLKHDLDFKIVCTICGKGFIKKSDLFKHMKAHSNKKPHICSICGNSYKSISNLNQHLKIHSNKNQLKCNVCNKDFSRKDALEDHMNHHLGKKPYKCMKCPKIFANRLNLYTHIKKHEGKLKGRTCPECGKVFYNGFKVHLQSHSGQKPFSCDKCGALFTVKSSLNKHSKLKHGNP